MIYGKMEGPPVTRALQQVGEELAAVLGFDSSDEKVRMMIANMIYLEYQITVAGSTVGARTGRGRGGLGGF